MLMSCIAGVSGERLELLSESSCYPVSSRGRRDISIFVGVNQMITAELQPSPELSPVTKLALAVFDEPKAAIAACKAYCQMTVAKDGIGKVTESRVKVKKLRVSIDKRREEQNAAALEHQRTVNAFARGLIAEVREIEGYLAKQEEEYEAAKEAARQAKEAARLAALQVRVDKLAAAGCGPADIPLLSSLTDEGFESHLASEIVKTEAIRAEEAAAAEAARIEQAKADEARRIQEESEQLKRQEEAERLAAQRAKEDAERAEQQEIARKKQEQEQAELREQQEQIAAQHAALQARIDAERRETEAREYEAEMNLQAAERQARLDALKPEIEKARTFTTAMLAAAKFELAKLGDPSWGANALAEIADACGTIVHRVEFPMDVPF